MSGGQRRKISSLEVEVNISKLSLSINKGEGVIELNGPIKAELYRSIEPKGIVLRIKYSSKSDEELSRGKRRDFDFSRIKLLKNRYDFYVNSGLSEEGLPYLLLMFDIKDKVSIINS